MLIAVRSLLGYVARDVDRAINDAKSRDLASIVLTMARIASA